MLRLRITTLVFLVAASSWCAAMRSSAEEVYHDVAVIHPGVDVATPVTCRLVEVRNASGHPTEFYLDVPSVVCGDSQCRVDTVRIFWNAFGDYERLLLPFGVELEKKSGDFTPADYAKLDKILRDPNLALRDVFKHEVVGTLGSEGVDGMTGATILLEEAAYVKGAVWTCYSLWHWVNGPLRAEIQDITGAACSATELRQMLANNDHPTFAMTQLASKQNFSEASRQSLRKYVQQFPGEEQTVVAYLEAAPEPVYLSEWPLFLSLINEKERVRFLRSLLNASYPLASDYFDDLLGLLPDFDNQEVKLFLRIVRAKNVRNQQLDSAMVRLLDSTNFLIARSAYWYLQDVELGGEQKRAVRLFAEQWKDRL